MCERHDVFAEKNVTSSYSGPRAKQINFVGPFIMFVSCDSNDGCEFTVLLKAITMNLFGTDIGKAAPALEHPKVGICSEMHMIGACEDHLLRDGVSRDRGRRGWLRYDIGNSRGVADEEPRGRETGEP